MAGNQTVLPDTDRLAALFSSKPRDWGAIGAALSAARRTGAAAPADIRLAYAKHLEADGDLEGAWSEATEAALSVVLAADAWKVARRVAVALNDSARASHAADRLLSAEPNNSSMLRKAMRSAKKSDRPEDAVELLKRSIPHMEPGPDLIKYKRFVDEVPELESKLIAWAQSLPETASPSESLNALNFLVERQAEVPAHLSQNVLDNEDPAMSPAERVRSLVRAYERSGEHDKAQAVYRQFVEGGNRLRRVRFLPYALEVPGLTDELLAWAKTIDAQSSNADRKMAMQIFTFHGMRPPPQLAPDGEADDKLQKAWELWGEGVPGDEELKRPPLQNYASEEIVVSRSTTPGPVVIVFSGLTGNFSIPPPAFDRFLAALDVTGVFMSDRARLGFTTGSKSLGTDFDGTVTALNKMVADMGATRVVVIGLSAGGFSALLYGLHMKADKILTFSPVTNATADHLSDDPRGRLAAKRAARTVEPRNLDVRPMINAPGNTTDIHIWYGEDTVHDTRNAKHLEGMPRVHLHTVPNFGEHQTMRELVRRGQFMSILKKALFD